MGKNKGKKKQQAGGEPQATPAPSGPQPGPSGDVPSSSQPQPQPGVSQEQQKGKQHPQGGGHQGQQQKRPQEQRGQPQQQQRGPQGQKGQQRGPQEHRGQQREAQGEEGSYQRGPQEQRSQQRGPQQHGAQQRDPQEQKGQHPPKKSWHTQQQQPAEHASGQFQAGGPPMNGAGRGQSHPGPQHPGQSQAGGSRGAGRGQPHPSQQHPAPGQSQPQGRGAPAWGKGRGDPQQGQFQAEEPRGAGRGQPHPSPQYPAPGQSQPQGRGAPEWGKGRGDPQQGQFQAEEPRGAGRGQPHPSPQHPAPGQSQPQGRGAPVWGIGRGAPPQQQVPGQTQPDPRSFQPRGQDDRGHRQQPQALGPAAQQQARPWEARKGSQPQQAAAQPSQQRSPPGMQQQKSGPSSATMQIARIDAGDENLVSKIRKNPGTLGRIIKVESNHLQLNLGKLDTAYHYDITIDPDTPKRYMRPVMDSFRRKHFPQRWPAFDGKKNVYTSSPLSNNLKDIFEDDIVLTEEDGREKKYHVTIKFANKVDLRPLKNFMSSPATPQEALQVVDIVLRMAPVQTCFPVGRSFFIKPAQGIIDLGEGMEMYHGFYQSAIRGWKPLLNVDVAHKAFPQNVNCVEALAQLLSTFRQKVTADSLRTIQAGQRATLEKYVKQLRVCYEIPGHPNSKKNYRCNGLGDSPRTATFESNGVKMTVLEYFLRAKNYQLRYPDLPTLWVGSQTRKILLPLELCTILEGQAVNRKMTENQTSNMIRQAATNTEVRKQKIMRGINQANYNASPYVNEFGFSVGNEFQKLNARVLEPPQLQYNNRTVRVQKGVWRNDVFLQPVKIERWTIATVCPRYGPRPDDLRNMAQMFKRMSKDVGMSFSDPIEPYGNIGGRQSFGDCEQYFRSQKGKFDIIFVVVPDSGPQYGFVKKAAEIATGCLTQCVKSNTVSRKMNPQTVINILLKVNSKLNGINHTFVKELRPKILMRPVMIMGADVTHPGPDARNIPSVAAVTASHDPKAFQYNICWRLQNPTVEIIDDLEAITTEHLKFFYEKTRVKPEAILFFRDGVSEGQFEQVKNAEIRAIRGACKKMQADGYEPKITFLVVQKRHHTRLFPMNPRDSEDRNCNVPAGTCVDTEIVHPFLQDFYLVSHASIQGVAKPTKYCTLWDDNDLDNDAVEQLSYYLCHMFTRCNRSVSYPAPTYYAHLAAARAKVYIESEQTLNMARLNEEFKRFQIQTSIQKNLPMFFV